eukprot:1704589-Amphidinium_carterae.2
MKSAPRKYGTLKATLLAAGWRLSSSWTIPLWPTLLELLCCPAGPASSVWPSASALETGNACAVAYLSWLALGRPWGWSRLEQHPLLFALSEQQSHMCDQLLHSFMAVCRPGRSLSHPGGGLAHLMTLVARMASDYHGAAAASPQDPNIALPLVSGQVSLPSCAATVDLQDPKVLPQRLIGYLSDESRLFKSEQDLQGPRPQMHCDVENWPALASDLWQCGLTRWVPTGHLPTIRGALKRSGLFGVAKATGSQLRLIVDRRPANWGEYNLRELLLDDLTKETVDFDEFEQLWRLMSLPHAAVLQDIFLGRQGRVESPQRTARTTSTSCVYLDTSTDTMLWGGAFARRTSALISCEMISHHRRLRNLAASGSFALCLKVVPMGDRKAMEVAQAVHQHIHLAAGMLIITVDVFSPVDTWVAPTGACISLGLNGACAASAIRRESRQRLDPVKERYGEVCLNLKAQKEQLRAPEASVWGAVVSSDRRDVRGNLEKVVFLTVELLRVRFVTTHTVQKVVGYWVYHCLFQRAGLCILQETYRWLEAGSDRLHAPRVLPDFIRQELQGYILAMLFPLLKSDLASCINLFLYASDATCEIGAVVKAPMDLPDAVLAWSRRTHHLSPGVAVLEANQLYRLEREERKDQVWKSWWQSSPLVL